MAGVTVRWRILIPVKMAGQTFKTEMSAGQGKLRLAMIETGGRPAIRRVADGAISAEIICHMIGILNRIVIILVTGETIGGGVVVAVGVT